MSVSNAVSSVAEFVTRVLDIHAQSTHTRSTSVSSITFYRGQSNADWGLAPRLYREGLFQQERLLISELLRVAPAEFAGLDYFDTLVKMQHYGLPTRLLDTTANPLVALFFACHSEAQANKDGAVYIIPSLPVFRPDNFAVKQIMKYVFEYAGPHVEIRRFFQDVADSGLIPTVLSSRPAAFKTVLSTISEAPYHAVLPTLRNQRLVNQDGTFLLFGMRVGDIKKSTNPGTLNQLYYEFETIKFENVEDLWHAATVIGISHRHKKPLLGELELLGITKSRMFPELEHQASFVTASVEKLASPPATIRDAHSVKR